MIDYDYVFENLPRYLDIPLKRKGPRWVAQYYMDLTHHRRREDKLVFLKKSNSILVIENGGDTMSLVGWLQKYGRYGSAREVYQALDGDRKVSILEVDPKYFARESPSAKPSLQHVEYYNVLAYMTPQEWENNSLYCYLETIFGRKDTRNAFLKYKVGCDGNTVVYWYINSKGKVCHDNRIVYKEDGHRDKERHAWRKFKTGDGYTERCLFGDHMHNKGIKQYIVESEKSALILKMAFPMYNFYACGGKNQLGCVKEKDKGKYILLPDNEPDSFSLWESKGIVEDWRLCFCGITWGSTPNHGDDVADMVLRYMSSQMGLNDYFLDDVNFNNNLKL